MLFRSPSVNALTENADPVSIVEENAKSLILKAMETGWEGPPFDIFQLADMLGFEIMPYDLIRDARLIPIARGRFRIEYNPNQPKARIRFSVAHEIAHTLFPDCREHIRNRDIKHDTFTDDWQLEMLCNIGAAELLMPVGSFVKNIKDDLSIDAILDLRKQYQVSTEAVLLRLVRLARIPCAVFGASRQSSSQDRLRVDYIQTANNWTIPLYSGFRIPSNSALYECGAIGYTAKNNETWTANTGQMHVECVAIPSYPGANHPRIVGILSAPNSKPVTMATIKYVAGDATKPRGDGVKIIAQIVNNTTPRWGGGFARIVKKKWPEVQDDFIYWANQQKLKLSLGETHLYQIQKNLCIFHIIAQHGYGESKNPRIRYRALESGLQQLSEIAKEKCASVHMPRIGCGQAGGSWPVVSELIAFLLCRKGVDVTVYDLPSERDRWVKPPLQRTLFDSPDVI